MRLPHYDFNLRLSWPPPGWLIVLALIGVVMSWFPLVMIAWAHMDYSDKPRIHFFQDMDNQARKGAQDTSQVFADGRAMRPPVPGTVAWAPRLSRADETGQYARIADPAYLRLDDHYWRGYREVAADARAATQPAGTQPATTPATTPATQPGPTFAYFDGFPRRLTIDAAFIELGQQKYNTACAPCHGITGYGDGPVHRVAAGHANNASINTVWVQPANLHQLDTATGKPKYGQGVYEDGRLYHVITFGKGNMSGYQSQVPDPHDRWAIAAYVRVLQAGQSLNADAIPAEQVDALKDAAAAARAEWQQNQEQQDQ